jgi:hypothetical protein
METLKGKNIIERMNQLMSYGKGKTEIKESGRNWGNLEYTIKAPNGKTYGIIRDNTKFFIKETTVEKPTIKDFDYIGGVVNGSKKYHQKFSEAIGYLNLMIKEMNAHDPKSKSINLLESKKEKEVDEKTVLKMPKAEPAPAPAPAAPAQDAPPAQPTDGGLDLGGDTGGDNLDLGGGDEDTTDPELDFDGEGDLGGDEETKQIQKLTGKLGQKMRDQEEPNPDVTKYVINSILASLELSELEPTDQKQILKKVKKNMAGKDEEEETDDLDLGDDTEDTEDTLDFGDDTEDTGENTDEFPTGDEAPAKEKPMQEISKGLASKAYNQTQSQISQSGNDPISAEKFRKQGQQFRTYTNPAVENEIKKLGGKIIDNNSKVVEIQFPLSHNGDSLELAINSKGYNIKHGDINTLDVNMSRKIANLIKKVQADLGTQDELPNQLEECDAPYGEKKEPQNIKSANAPYKEKTTKLKTESRVRKTIGKYFEITPGERKQETKNFVTESINRVDLLTEGKSKCKSIEQELALAKVLNYGNGFKIKTMNESVIVETPYTVNLSGKEYKKLIMVETTGKTSAILKDVETKNARQYRMENKNDYLNFIKLGK